MGLRNLSNKRFELKKYSAVSLSHKLIDKNIFPIINIDKSFENVLNYQIKSLKPDKLLIREPIYDNEIKIYLSKFLGSLFHLLVSLDEISLNELVLLLV